MQQIQFPGRLVAGDKASFGGAYPLKDLGTGLNNIDCDSYPAPVNTRIWPVAHPLDPSRPTCVQYEVHPGDKQPHYGASGERSELWYEPHDGSEGSSDGFVSSWVIPEGFGQMPNTWLFLCQNHPGPGYTDWHWPSLNLANGLIKFEVLSAFKQFDVVQTGRELFLAVEQLLKTNGGFCRCWLSWDKPPDVTKTPFVEEYGNTLMGDPMWWKTGIYRGESSFTNKVIQTTLARRPTLAEAVVASGWPAISGGVVIPPPIPLPGWKQTFVEEFDSSPLARGWQPTFAYGGTPAGHTKGDPEVATETNDSWVSDASGVSIANGVCTFTLRKGPGTDEITGKIFPYKTGLLNSGGIYDWKKYPEIVMLKPALFAQKYGKFEAEIKGPSVPGTGLGWWLLPTTYKEGSQGDGEIDIMELIANSPTVGRFAIHRGYTPGRHFEAQAAIPNGSDDFHTYGVEWGPDEVRWYVDGVEKAKCTDASLIPSVPMYMMLGLGSGNGSDGWLGAVDESKLPATMQIRSIRVYERTTVVPSPITVAQTIKQGDTLTGTVTWVAVTWVATTSDDSKVKQVDFSIDGKHRNTESSPPWGSGDPPNTDAGQFNTKPLADGPHVFKAAALLKDGTTSSTEATAIVKNVVAPPAPTNVQLRDQAVVALKLTTITYEQWKKNVAAGKYPEIGGPSQWGISFEALSKIK